MEGQNEKEGISAMKRVAAGAVIGVAVPAAVGAARKLLASRHGGGENQGGSSRSKGRSRSSNSSGSNRTKDQLYDEAKRLKIEGRSTMTKAQLERAISRAKS
jgi:hypothetical protein